MFPFLDYRENVNDASAHRRLFTWMARDNASPKPLPLLRHVQYVLFMSFFSKHKDWRKWRKGGEKTEEDGRGKGRREGLQGRGLKRASKARSHSTPCVPPVEHTVASRARREQVWGACGHLERTQYGEILMDWDRNHEYRVTRVSGRGPP